MLNRPSRPCLHPLAAAIVLAASAPAWADAETDKVDRQTMKKVEVTGEVVQEAASPKFTAPLLDTPQTLSIVSSEVFAMQGAQNLTDVLRNTPGISFNAGENGFSSDTSNFSLRGFDTSGSIFVDGVRDSGSLTRDVFNLEQVEIAKGPAADYGRGGLGGYVNQVSKTPQPVDFIRGTASLGVDSYDSDNRLRATFDINQTLGSDSALRVNLLAQDGGIAGRQHATRDTLGIAPSLALGLNGDTRFTLALQHLKQSGRPDWGVPGALISGTVNYDAQAAAAQRDRFYGLEGDFDDQSSTSALARIEHRFGNGAVLSNQLRWSQARRSAQYTIPFGYTPASASVVTQTQAYDRDNDSLSNITDLSLDFSGGAVEHSLALGLEFSSENSEGLRFPTINPAAPSVFDPDFARASVTLAPTQRSAIDIDTLAAYVYDTMRFNEQWQLTGGLRVERYEVEIASRTIAGASTGTADGYNSDETTVSGKLGLVYKPSQSGSVYGSVGIATLPPGSFLSNPDISRTGDNAFPGLVGQNNESADPQRAINAELGMKWNFFDDHLSTTAALFRTERRNVAISGKEPGDATSPTLLRGYGEQIVQGIELGINGRLTDAWTVFAGAVFLDSERRHSAFLDAARREANPNDYGAVLATSGDELSFTPKRSANLWTTYAFDNGLTLGGGVQHVGDSWAGRPDDADRIIPNGRFGKLPGYTVGNLMAAYRVNDALQLRLNIDNVSDKTYAVSGNWGVTRVFLGAPRSYLLSADFRF